MSLLLRLLLALGYPLLAHAASVHGDGRWAALALADVVVFMLIDGLLERRIGAWLACVAALAGLVALARSPWSMALLLLVPVLFIWMIAWVFARTLLPGRVPLITRLVAAIDATTPDGLAPELNRYTRAVTTTWALALGLLGLGNLNRAGCPQRCSRKRRAAEQELTAINRAILAVRPLRIHALLPSRMTQRNPT